MADPVTYAIQIGKWTKVATAVRIGHVLPLRNLSSGGYMQTIRNTGNPAPTDGDYSDAKDFDFFGCEILSPVPIDVYVSVTGSIAGRVRVDL